MAFFSPYEVVAITTLNPGYIRPGNVLFCQSWKLPSPLFSLAARDGSGGCLRRRRRRRRRKYPTVSMIFVSTPINDFLTLSHFAAWGESGDPVTIKRRRRPWRRSRRLSKGPRLVLRLVFFFFCGTFGRKMLCRYCFYALA